MNIGRVLESYCKAGIGLDRVVPKASLRVRFWTRSRDVMVDLGTLPYSMDP